MNDKKKGRSTEIDRHIGTRMRQRRELSNMSQEDLAHAIGVSFQQVQKYEAGKNRLSGSRLYAAANALGVSVEFFYLGLRLEDT